MIEIERKFLVKRLPEPLILFDTIHQGYLSTKPKRTVRVRCLNQRKQAFLTVKGKTKGCSRSEFEYPIPYEDGCLLLAMCKGTIIKKNRYIYPYSDPNISNLQWEIDVFEEENEGLVLAEIELETEDQSIILPEWIGSEVTKDVAYSNSVLTKYPISKQKQFLSGFEEHGKQKFKLLKSQP